MAITARVEGLDEAQASLLGRTAKIIAALEGKIWKLELELQAKIVGNLDAGIGLKSRHGTSGIAGSVRAIEPAAEGTKIIGNVQGGGGPFWYGKMWEDVGHKEIVPVNKKVLSWMADGKRVFAMRVSAQGPRPWMRPPWEEFKPTIISELNQTVQSGGNE